MKNRFLRSIVTISACSLISACAVAPVMAQAEPPLQWEDMVPESSMELSYAAQFNVDYYQDGIRLITISDDQKLLLIPSVDAADKAPADSEITQSGSSMLTPDLNIEGIPADVTVVGFPVNNIYMAATSSMDHFRQLEAIDTIAFSSQKADSWYVEEARQAMETGDIIYAGKYSAPDYELLVSGNCGLAIENTMIYHSPEVIEQLERLGVPVLVERSSYEDHPLGRMEWIKLYGALIGKEDAACAYFDSLAQEVEDVASQENTGLTVAFFSINSIGAVNVRKSGDYIAKSINMAGGQYISYDESEEENALSTMNVQMETFYSTARDADVIIYNSTIEGEVQSIDELLVKSPLLADFKAVQNGNAWCIERNFYQQSLELGDFILDVHRILTDPDADDESLYFLHRLK